MKATTQPKKWNAGINLNPYQGLKLTDALSSLASNAPEST